MPTKPKRKGPGRPAEVDRDKLLSVAENLFSERGFAGTSTRDLAKEAGCNVAMISYYFGGKEGLYEALLNRHFERSRHSYDASAIECSLEEFWPEFKNAEIRRFCASLYGFARTTVNNRTMHKVLVREVMSGADSMITAMVKNDSGVLGPLRKSLQELQQKKLISSKLDLNLTMVSLIGPIVHSCTSAAVLKRVYGLKAIDEKYMRSLCVHLTNVLFGLTN